MPSYVARTIENCLAIVQQVRGLMILSLVVHIFICL